MMLARLSLSFIFAVKTLLVTAISRDDFYPFGSAHSDSLLSRGDEAVSMISNLPSPFPFFGELHEEIHISNDGLISFSTPPDSSSPQKFPINGHIIAPFWADVDTTLRGRVWYRVTTDHATLQRVNEQLNAANKSICTPQYVVVVTWESVSYYRLHFNETNTFQCVLATNGSRSSAIFLYEQDGIQWTTGDASGGTFGVLTEANGIAAVAGINGNETHYTSIQSSGTQNIINIASTSNVNVSGVWIFQLDGDKLAKSCTNQQSQTKMSTLAVGTVISVILLVLIVLILAFGALYGYCQIGRLILALRSQEKSLLAEKELPRQESKV